MTSTSSSSPAPTRCSAPDSTSRNWANSRRCRTSRRAGPLSKPVIGAINGAAVTGGLELTLYCDILIASEQARFADTHARVGLLPTWGRSVRLPQKVGIGLARRMSMTGDYLSAAGRPARRPGDGSRSARPAVADRAQGRGHHRRQQPDSPCVRCCSSYHRIDEPQTSADSGWKPRRPNQFRTIGDDIAANREAVLERGRAQVRRP